jgi:hypothetical protein
LISFARFRSGFVDVLARKDTEMRLEETADIRDADMEGCGQLLQAERVMAGIR